MIAAYGGAVRGRRGERRGMRGERRGRRVDARGTGGCVMGYHGGGRWQCAGMGCVTPLNLRAVCVCVPRCV